MIEAEGLWVDAGSRALLRDVGVRLEPGRMLAVIGPNGAGKSTLLRTLAGDRPPSAGSVRMNDRGLDAWPRRERARRRAVLLQDSGLAFPFAAGDVVLLGRAPHLRGAESAGDRAIAAAALDAVGAAGLATRSYLTLSGGEKQRVQLARVLAQIWEPVDDRGRYLLLDEPTSSLDPRHQHQVLSLGRDLAASGVGVLAVLHDLNLAAQYADRVLLLRAGGVVAEGAPASVLTAATLSAAFELPIQVLPHPERPWPIVVVAPHSPQRRHGLRPPANPSEE